MSVVLIDYQNVSDHGLEGAEFLKERDTLMIYTDANNMMIRQDHIDQIETSGCIFHCIRLKTARKDALDRYMDAEIGELIAKGETEIAIISRDNGFQSVIDYYVAVKGRSDLRLIRADKIATALPFFSDPEDHDRRVAIIRNYTMHDLGAFATLCEERQKFREQISSRLRGTEYEEKTAEIIDFLSAKEYVGRKTLYTDSMHSFGLLNGRRIYNLVKDIV